MYPIKLKIKDFLSFEDAEYTFKNKAILLVGENLTEIESQESNGSGKSNFQSAIAYCILQDSLIGGARDVDLVRFDQSSAELLLEVHCPIRKQTMVIERKIPNKGSSKLQLSLIEGGESRELTFSGVKDGNRMILDWIKIEAEDLKNYFFITKENHKSFFTSSNTEKLKLIGRFSKSDFLDNIKPYVEEDVQVLQEKIKSKTSEKDKLWGKNELLEEQLKKEKEVDPTKVRQELIEKLQEKVVEKKSENIETFNLMSKGNAYIITVESEIEKEKVELKKFVESLSKSKTEDSLKDAYTLLRDEAVKLVDKKRIEISRQKELTEYFEDYKKEIMKINVSLSGMIECPKCKFKFNPMKEGEDEAELIDEKKEVEKVSELTQKALDAVEKTIKNINSNISAFEMEEGELNKERDLIRKEVDSLKKNIAAIESQIDDKENIISRSKRKLETYKSMIDQNVEELTHINKQIKEVKETPLEEKDLTLYQKEIDRNLETIESYEKEIEECSVEALEVTQWTARFKEFRMHLALEQIKVIERHTNRFLKEMKCDVRILIEAFKPLANGELREEITPVCIRDRARSYSSFSGGERAKMLLSMIFAQQYMINSTNPYGGFHFLLLDEVSESIDGKGLVQLIDSLNLFDFPILLTTHVNNMRVGVETLLMRKINGKTIIVNN